MVTNPIMRYTPEFYRAEVRRGVETIVRRRLLAAELERARKRLATEQGPFLGDGRHAVRRALLAAELRRGKERSR